MAGFVQNEDRLLWRKPWQQDLPSLLVFMRILTGGYPAARLREKNPGMSDNTSQNTSCEVLQGAVVLRRIKYLG
jgi:hypothetical protein